MLTASSTRLSSGSTSCLKARPRGFFTLLAFFLLRSYALCVYSLFMATKNTGAETMETFIAYNMNTHRICGFVRAKSKRAAVWAFKRQRYFEGRCFGGKFGIQTEPLSEWNEDSFERSGGFAIPRSADIQRDLIAAFGWEIETCSDCGGRTLPLDDSVRFCVDCDAETETAGEA